MSDSLHLGRRFLSSHRVPGQCRGLVSTGCQPPPALVTPLKHVREGTEKLKVPIRSRVTESPVQSGEGPDGPSERSRGWNPLRVSHQGVSSFRSDFDPCS